MSDAGPDHEQEESGGPMDRVRAILRRKDRSDLPGVPLREIPLRYEPALTRLEQRGEVDRVWARYPGSDAWMNFVRWRR